MNEESFDDYVSSHQPNNHSSRVYTEWGLAENLLDFGSVVIGQSSTKITGVGNTGTSEIYVTDVVLQGPFALNQVSGTMIDPGASSIFEVTFSPSEEGNYSGKITCKVEGEEVTINIIGSGVVSPTDGWDHTQDIENMVTGLWAFIQRSVRPALT